MAGTVKRRHFLLVAWHMGLRPALRLLFSLRPVALRALVCR